ncbi:MAG: GNAT family N-acetyltransferase [Actinomycetes bacterium]
MQQTPAPAIDLPRQRGAVTVRLGSLDDDLDGLNDGNELWWGQDFVADRIRSSPPDDPWMILVGEVDQDPVGYAFVLGKGLQAGGYAMSDLYVVPHGRCRGVGRALVEALTDATREYRLPGFLLSAPDQDVASLAIADRWGFRLVGRHRESVLDLDTLDVETATAAVHAAESAGFRLTPLPDDADDSTWQRAYDLSTVLWRDAPDAEGATDDMPYSVFRAFFPDPSYVVMAWRGDEPVGFTSLMDRTKDAALNTLFTGVTRVARGHGLATGLKAAHALLMRELGHHRIYTQNMEGNAAILAANDRLGFRADSGCVDLARAVPVSG